jgi:hypothetical protein
VLFEISISLGTAVNHFAFKVAIIFQISTFIYHQFMKLKLCLLILVCEAIGTAATPGLLCQSRVMVKMIVEKQMECRLAEETEVLGENLPQGHFCPSQNPT